MSITTGYRGTVAERMRRKYSIDPETGCWPWHGSKDTKGYGQIRIDGRAKIATHVALELVGKPRTADQPCALHHCDNPSCVNPAHLRWGTMRDNTQDSIARNRANPSGLELGWALARARKQPLPIVSCERCGAEFATSKARFHNNRRHFCSLACSRSWQSANFTGKPRGS